MTSPFLSNQKPVKRSAPLFWDTVLRETMRRYLPPGLQKRNATESIRLARPGRVRILLNPCAAPLNQNDKHNDKQHARDNLNNGGIVHEIPLSEFLASLCFLPGLQTARNGRQTHWSATRPARVGTRQEGSTLQQTKAPG